LFLDGWHKMAGPWQNFNHGQRSCPQRPWGSRPWRMVIGEDCRWTSTTFSGDLSTYKITRTKSYQTYLPHLLLPDAVLPNLAQWWPSWPSCHPIWMYGNEQYLVWNSTQLLQTLWLLSTSYLSK
jgi:hypothetical protein